VLTVTDFGQGSLDALTSSPVAPGTLSAALIPLLQGKSLDGVNFDSEGEGSGDQVGLTNLVTAVSGALRAADPHWQITMDTYASSAGDPGGFYDIPALAPAVDAFFIMDYELNLAGAATAASPLASGMFTSQTTLAQYTAAVPASKVILGTPFFGIDWPTNNGTMATTATGGAADIADSLAQANGPQYWDPVTHSAWTSYQVGGQWHESYYEGEDGLYDISQVASHYGVRGVGIWALGMESDGAQMIAALDGISPGAPPGTGPQSTSSSPVAVAAPPGPANAPSATPAPAPAPASAAGPSPAPAPPTTVPGAGGWARWRRWSRREPRFDAGPVSDHHHGPDDHRHLQRRDGGADSGPVEPGPGRAARGHTDGLPVQRRRLRVPQRRVPQRLRQREREARGRGHQADQLHRPGLPAAVLTRHSQQSTAN
jgi:Glycosyl hydrolases family 18